MTDARTVCYRHSDRPTGLSCTECGKPICVECSHDAPVGQKCPECARHEGRGRVVDARQAVRGPSFETSPVTFSIIAITVAGFLFTSVIPSDAGDNLWRELVFFGPFVEDGEIWRMLTVTLLHGSWLHIGFNMYALYLFGPMLERQTGSVPFAAMYYASAATGSLASLVFGEDVPAVGASGAIFGLFGAWLFVSYKIRSTPAGRAMFNQLSVLLAINLALPFFVSRIDWRAHLGGLAGGVLIAFLWSQLAVGRPNARAIRTVSAGALLVAALVVGFVI
ncbi:MAG: rhomboid family intramembrane serine protease [Acidimicrobiia bacterium]|nr:rhomboid family intramembrane serine protease [Acidimicrobiia bacterium]